MASAWTRELAGPWWNLDFLLLGALPFTTWPGYLPENVGIGRDRAVRQGAGRLTVAFSGTPALGEPLTQQR